MRRGPSLLLVALVSLPRATWPQGDPLGPEFRVNTFTTDWQVSSAVAAGGSGDFVSLAKLCRTARLGSASATSSGTPLARVPRQRRGIRRPSVTAERRPSSCRSDTDGSSGSVFAATSSGAPLGPEFRVNTYTTSSQSGPSVTADTAGNFVVVWSSYSQDGSGFGVFGQRYGQIIPVELMHLKVE